MQSFNFLIIMNKTIIKLFDEIIFFEKENNISFLLPLQEVKEKISTEEFSEDMNEAIVIASFIKDSLPRLRERINKLEKFIEETFDSLQ